MTTPWPYGGLLMGDPHIEAVHAAIGLLFLLIGLSVTALALGVQTVWAGRGLWRGLVAAMILLTVADVSVLAKWNALRQWANTAVAGRRWQQAVIEPAASACHVLLLWAAMSLCIGVLVAAICALRDWLQDILVPCAAVAALVGQTTARSRTRPNKDKDIR
ncbi:Uncharacterised protein [Mycobacteroides abscessus subsp. abscessus]|uniref:hypothetical protein n=1 Tax=Mycobacteroides abscessus TaxID=36809 RepID=UPI0009A7F51C|nr:hypothetical protein [Mycobacteroides abscessus]SLI19935.1 Uncharacterised protein [Mycobacteroides abscessus subsp. abscessus]